MLKRFKDGTNALVRVEYKNEYKEAATGRTNFTTTTVLSGLLYHKRSGVERGYWMSSGTGFWIFTESPVATREIVRIIKIVTL